MSMHRTILTVTIALILALTAASTGAAQSATYAQGSPELDAFLSNNEVTPGTEAELSVQIANSGELTGTRSSAKDRKIVTTARSVQVALDADRAPITVETGGQSIGDVETSAPETIPFNIVIPEAATPGTYTLEVHIDYNYIESAEDTAVTAPTVDTKSRGITETVRLDISDDAQFDVTEVDSKLFVGEEGRISGRLKNVGGSIARNTEIKFTPTNENINALSSTVAAGDISAGDSVPFSIPVEVTSGAEAVPHRFDLDVNYRDENGISQSTNDPEFLADIKGDRDAFLVEPVNNTIPAGGNRPLDVRVTNNLNETVTDIEGKFFADDPLDSTNDETFTGSLGPGETTTVTVDLSASGGATIKNYPASIDFRYVDSEGDSKLTDSYQVAITVTEPETSGGPPVGLLVGLLVVLAVGGYLGWRRGVFSMLR